MFSEPWRTNTGEPPVSTESFISLGFYPNQSFKNQVTQTWGLGHGGCASLPLSSASSRKEGGSTGRQKPDSSSNNGSDDVTEPAPSSPKPWLQPLWLGVGGGQNPSQAPPFPSSDSLPGGSTQFIQQETEAHGEEEVGEEDTGEAGRWHNEGRGERPLDTPPPPPPWGGARKPHHHTAFGEMRWGLRLWGPKARRAAGLSRSHASRCARSRILAQHPRT